MGVQVRSGRTSANRSTGRLIIGLGFLPFILLHLRYGFGIEQVFAGIRVRAFLTANVYRGLIISSYLSFAPEVSLGTCVITATPVFGSYLRGQ